ncbi:MAG: DUF1552 domain-containing protein [Rubripirellula sp.]|nr:DUF1552 domain-containing protein [Rubripirellula sp.]
MNLSRRRFLRSSTGIVALPALESLTRKNSASAASVQRPVKRMVFLGFGWGVTRDDWFPDKSISGNAYELPSGLQPLQRHKNDITVLQNLSNQFSSEAHWGSTFYLTGANRYAEPGKSFHNTISADQVAAEKFGLATRFTSLQLGCKDAENSGHGPGLSLAWNRQGKPVAGLDNPVAAYHKLFSDGKTPLAQRQLMLKKQRSVLDAVMEDAKDVGRGLGRNDADKLGEYLQSVRDIETRLSKEEQWLDVPKSRPAALPEEPQGTVAGYEEIKVMYDLMIAAMQVDATRVFTYRQPVESLLKSFGATITGHNMSHYTNGDRKSVSQTRDQKQSELLAYFIDRLKATREADGSRLFDHVSLSYGSNINSIHYLTNCPTIITGGGAGIELGQHLVLAPKTPLANLWLSLLRGVGIDVASHGDSSGIIKELFA